MNKDELKGKAKDVKGQAKEGAGDITGNERLQSEGAADQAEGQIQETWGRGKRKAGETVEDIGERMKD